MLQGVEVLLCVVSGAFIGVIASIALFACITKDNFDTLANKLNEFDEMKVYENSDIRIFKNRKGQTNISQKDTSLSIPEIMKKHAAIIEIYQKNYEI